MAAVTTLALTGALALAACGGQEANKASTGAGGGASVAGDCFTGNLTGEGSSAQKNAIEVAIAQYGAKCSGANISYNATGSGAGVKQFTAQQVNFGGTDSVLKDDEKVKAKEGCGSEAWDIPMVVGPLGVAYNVKGIDKLVLDAPTMAKVFNGKITTWNDPAIAKLNPGASLPSTAIKVYFRSDESGTTENFTKYLKAAAPSDWTMDASKKWTGSVGEGKPQNAGVAQAVKAQDGAIGYLEWSYITQNNLKMASVDTGSGKPVELTAESVGKAVNIAKQVGTGNDLALKLDYATKAEGAYPMILVTYELVCSKYKDAETGKKVKSFLKLMATSEVQKKMQDKGYAPLPQEMQQKVTKALDAIQ